jgi:hypothetical protein
MSETEENDNGTEHDDDEAFPTAPETSDIGDSPEYTGLTTEVDGSQ